MGQSRKSHQVNSVSAQIALVLSFALYTRLHGPISKGTFYSNGQPDSIDSDKLSQFVGQLETIVAQVVSENSTREVSFWHRFTRGKLRYFDPKQKVLLSPKGRAEIERMLSQIRELAFNVHGLKKYKQIDALPLSPSRAVGAFSMTDLVRRLSDSGLLVLERFLILESKMSSFQYVFFTQGVGASIGAGLLVGLLMPTVESLHTSRSFKVALQYIQSCLSVFRTENDTKSMMVAANIMVFKTKIFIEASKQRSWILFCLNVFVGVISVLLGLILAAIVGASWFISIPVLFAFFAAAGTDYCVRYWQAQMKIYAKAHRAEITQAFQDELRAELAVYGLDPTEGHSNKNIDQGATDVRRRVEVDVESFLGKNKELLPSDRSIKEQVEWIKKNLPPEYKRYPDYFLKESAFQLREKEKPLEKILIDAERQLLFSEPAAQFFAKKQHKSISYLHQRIEIARYSQQSGLGLPSDQEVQASLSKNLGWNLLVRLSRGPNHVVDEASLKKDLAYTVGYAWYAARRFGIYPLQKGSEEVLNAYYVKRCAGVRRTLVIERAENKNSSIHHSSRRIFEDFLSENEKNKATDVDSKTSRQELKDEMQGVWLQSLVTGAGAALASLLPALPSVLSVAGVAVSALQKQLFNSGIISTSSFFMGAAAFRYRETCKISAQAIS